VLYFFPAGTDAISKLTTPEERGLYTGAVMAVSMMVGIGIAPTLFGAIADAWSFQAGIYLLGFGTLAVCSLLLFLRDM
jgi:MFS family permease